jgi:hypothetical protein
MIVLLIVYQNASISWADWQWMDMVIMKMTFVQKVYHVTWIYETCDQNFKLQEKII